MEFVFDWITQYGYIALFMCLMLGIVGLPIPDETLMVFCGYLISKGTLAAAPTWATAFAGSVCGITISYMLGRKLGMSVVTKYGKYFHLTPDKLDKVLKWFDRIGHWALFVGYYIAGVRHFSAVVAGTSGLKPAHFALYAYSGAAVWVTTFIAIGYFVGENWKTMAENVHHELLRASLVGFALLGVFFLFRWILRKRRGPS
jgi:membrane protein DedA with SNARE-associated domain